MVNDYIQTKVMTALYGAGDVEKTKKRKDVFARAFIARRKAWSDPVWVSIYRDWLKSGGEDIGLGTLRTYACINYKTIKNGMMGTFTG